MLDDGSVRPNGKKRDTAAIDYEYALAERELLRALRAKNITAYTIDSDNVRREIDAALWLGREFEAEVGEDVRVAIDLYEEGGMAALKPKERGREPGYGRILTPDQEAHIRQLIMDKRPEQLKMDFALWTRAAVGELIARECGVRLCVRAVGNYLKRWGFTPQKPIKRAYERRPEAIQKWLDDEYPAIAERAKDEDCEIHWGDETALINTDVRGRSYAPKGQTPVTCAPGKREKLSMISTVTNQGKTRWMVIDGNFDAGKLIEFLEALIKEHRKIFLILDNLRAHHSKLVKAWLEERKDRIEVFYLPSYAPELNPDEVS